MRAAEFLLIINMKCFVLSIDWIISGFLALKCFMLFLLLVSRFFSPAIVLDLVCKGKKTQSV